MFFPVLYIQLKLKLCDVKKEFVDFDYKIMKLISFSHKPVQSKICPSHGKSHVLFPSCQFLTYINNKNKKAPNTL